MNKYFNQYFKRVIFVCFLTAVGLMLLNIGLDIFGVFGFKKNIRVYGEERISKYLMAFRYIPENFDGVILGPSLSANINPEPVKEIRYYNASLMGARVQTMIPLLDRMLASKHQIKRAWVCIHPYMTQSNEMEGSLFMNTKTYWTAFGSVHLLRVYGFALIRWLNLAPNKYPSDQYLINGTNKFEPLFKGPDVEAKIEEEKAKLHSEDFEIAPIPEASLKELWRMLEANEIQTKVYFHPVPLPIYEDHKGSFSQYWEQVKLTYSANNPLITFENFNRSDFSFFTGDLSNYIDHGHLSEKGQQLLLKELSGE
ncbi:hypothetical protein [Cyclobacterium plantarum]|uniref:SGNH/GDSL hydrolase family protein n=1 Tax=Cyclobacterium plantarum TaxID=2716263 RepID=A0ABX0H1J3_9BACT|nr:hypothetical protein [Cyclobacterium plantarum]NHE55650.1 hypothetical protein [Cyclobacterium plantarum]